MVEEPKNQEPVDPVLENEPGDEPDVAKLSDIEDIKKRLQTEIARKKHWREKYQKKASQVVPPQTPTITNQPPKELKQDDDIRKKVDFLSFVEEKRQFGHTFGLAPDETDEVFAYAQGKGIKPQEAKDSPFIKSALEIMRAQRRADSAIPSSSSRTATVAGKTFAELKPEERRKNFEKITASFKK